MFVSVSHLSLVSSVTVTRVSSPVAQLISAVRLRESTVMIWRTDQKERADKCFLGAVLPARTCLLVGIWDFVLNEVISTSYLIQRLIRTVSG